MPPSDLSATELYQRLQTSPQAIAQFCEKWAIVELALFGSVLRPDFRATGADPSDIDLLYQRAPEAHYGFQFFDLQAELETLLKRKVDLISKKGIEMSRNPLRRQAILNSAKVIYQHQSCLLML
jgi:hypothetical protein